jgi:PKD repeat protein
MLTMPNRIPHALCALLTTACVSAIAAPDAGAAAAPPFDSAAGTITGLPAVTESGDSIAGPVVASFMNTGTSAWTPGTVEAMQPAGAMPPCDTFPSLVMLNESNVDPPAAGPSPTPGGIGTFTIDAAGTLVAPSVMADTTCTLSYQTYDVSGMAFFGATDSTPLQVLHAADPVVTRLDAAPARVRRDAASFPLTFDATDNHLVTAASYKIDSGPAVPIPVATPAAVETGLSFNVPTTALATGPHSVTVTVTDGSNGTRTGSALTNFVINARPSATPTIAASIVGGQRQIGLTANATDDIAGLVGLTYAWTLTGPGGPRTSTDANPVFTGVAPGTYQASLTVTDSDGETQIGSAKLTSAVTIVNQRPVLSFTTSHDRPRQSHTVTITPAVTDDLGADNVHFAYTLNGRAQAGSTFTVPQAGDYSVGVTATDSEGAVVSLSRAIRVIDPPTGQLISRSHDVPRTTPDIDLVLHNLGHGIEVEPGVLTIKWFVDGVLRPDLQGTSTTLRNAAPGTHHVIAVITDSDGLTFAATGTFKRLAGPARLTPAAQAKKIKAFTGATLQARSRTAKLTFGGAVFPRLLCPGGTLASILRPNDFGFCTGTVTILDKGRAIGKAKFGIRTGDGPNVEVPLSKAQQRRIKRLGKLKTTLVIVSTDGRSRKTHRASFTILPPG